MNRTFYFLIFILLVSCTPQNKTNEEKSSTEQTFEKEENKVTESGDRQVIPEQPPLEDSNTDEETSEDDCVFNNDIKGLTIDWLNELGIESYTWREDLEGALIPDGKDTIFISEGGCDHFGIEVELRLTNDQHLLADSLYFIEKALDLPARFKMDGFVKMIREKRIHKGVSSETNTWYAIEDDDPEDNLIYNGIEIVSDGNIKKINLSKYYN